MFLAKPGQQSRVMPVSPVKSLLRRHYSDLPSYFFRFGRLLEIRVMAGLGVYITSAILSRTRRLLQSALRQNVARPQRAILLSTTSHLHHVPMVSLIHASPGIRKRILKAEEVRGSL